MDLKGNSVHLSDFKGKIVVINIWGIGCGPCVAEMPELNQLVEQYRNEQNIVFLGITGDDAERLNKFLKTHEFKYKILNNAGGLNEKLNINALPEHLVIGKQGEIINRSVGTRDNIKNYLEQLINNNL